MCEFQEVEICFVNSLLVLQAFPEGNQPGTEKRNYSYSIPKTLSLSQGKTEGSEYLKDCMLQYFLMIVPSDILYIWNIIVHKFKQTNKQKHRSNFIQEWYVARRIPKGSITLYSNWTTISE